MNISVIGLGKLGLCTAACFAAAGHVVHGYDVNDHFRNELRARRSPVDETGLGELLERCWGNLNVVDSHAEAVAGSDITLIIVPTPSMSDGRFDNRYLVSALRDLAPALAAKSDFHVVDVVSTVMPGSCDGTFKPLLEELTGKRCGRGFGLVYNPEFIALGSVIHNFLNPDLVLIGASDQRSGDLVAGLYRSTCTSSPTISAMSLINAEITKISLNCYVTMKISYANALAEICQNVPGADIDVVTAAIGADSRVGSRYLKGGLGFGGPCFPRDNIAFQAFAEGFGSDAVLGKSVVSINKGVPLRLFRQLQEKVAPASRVAILGLSYKADTHITEESQSLMLAELLMKAGYPLSLHDPKALLPVRQRFGSSACYAADPYQAVAGAGAIVLMTDWPEYRTLDWDKIERLARPGAVVIDCWRILKERGAGRLPYLPVGVGPGARNNEP